MNLWWAFLWDAATTLFLVICGLTDEKINVIYQNRSEKKHWQFTEAFIHDYSKSVNKLTYSNLDNNIHLLLWLWPMWVWKVTQKVMLSFTRIKIHCLHYIEVINTLLFCKNSHESPVMHTEWSLFSENEAKTLYNHILDLILISFVQSELPGLHQFQHFLCLLSIVRSRLWHWLKWKLESEIWSVPI